MREPGEEGLHDGDLALVEGLSSKLSFQARERYLQLSQVKWRAGAEVMSS
jgi:hypothetical protein